MPEKNFREAVYNMVRQIPHGKVASYGQIAVMLGYIQGGRPVGTAMRYAPDDLPCHRVVHNDGVPGCVESHTKMLLDEGVMFKPNGKIDMEKCRWNGR